MAGSRLSVGDAARLGNSDRLAAAAPERDLYCNSYVILVQNRNILYYINNV